MDVLSCNVIASSAINVIMLIFLIYLISSNQVISKKSSVSFILASVFTIVSNVFETISFVVEPLGGSYRHLNLIAIVIGFSVSPCICIVLAVLYEEKVYNRLKYLCIPLIINAVLFIINPYNEWMFSLSAENVYSRGPLYFVYIIVYIYSICILMFCNHMQSKKYFKKERIFLMLLYGILIAGTTLQVVVPSFHTSWPCVTLSLVMYYVFRREISFKYDSLTNTLNRTVFDETLNKLKVSESTYIVLLDIDKFKTINDSYGHLNGDKYLKQSADIIKNCFKNIGECYRIGGDEFCVIAYKTSEIAVRKALETINAEIENKKKDDPIVPSISFGYSICNQADIAKRSEIFNKADIEMYQNKRNIK